MNKGTAIVGFFLCFLAGMGLMWGIDRKGGTTEIASEPGGAFDHSAAPVPVTSKDPIWGNNDAPVTIVEISDFQCPFCSRVGPTMKQIKDTYGPEKVRIVFKHNALPFHNNAKPAAIASLTVHGLGGNDAFWKFHDSAFANQQALTEDNFVKWAGEAGVDVAKFKEEFKANKYASKVDEDMAMARQIGANGTPNFRINGVEISGAQPFEKFKEVIDQQLAEAQKLVAAGTAKNEVYVKLTQQNAKTPPPEAAKPDQPQQPPEDTTIWRVPIAKHDPIKGPADALVTVVIFSDFQCPFCKRVEDTLKQVENTYKNDVRIVWKDNPLPFHPRAKPASNLGMVALATKGNQGFWAAHAAMFESQPKLEDDDLKAVSDKVGLNWTQVKAAIDSDKYAADFAEDMDLGSSLNARGTPHFFVNGFRITGAQPFEKFKEVIDKQLAVAKALVAKGTPKAKVYEEIMKEAKGPPEPETKDVPPPTKDNPSKGTGKVVIQMWSDFQCPFCKRVEPTLAQIEKEYAGKVKIVWRDLPLPFHQDAGPAAQAAREAFVQKGSAGFWKFHDALFEVQEKGIKRDALEKIAQDMGLDMAKFKAALDGNTHKAAIDADQAIAQKAGIGGTPAFVVGKYFVNGAQPYSEFKKLIDLSLKGK